MPRNTPGMKATVTAVAIQKRRHMKSIGETWARDILTIVNVLPQINVIARSDRSARSSLGIFTGVHLSTI